MNIEAISCHTLIHYVYIHMGPAKLLHEHQHMNKQSGRLERGHFNTKGLMINNMLAMLAHTQHENQCPWTRG